MSLCPEEGVNFEEQYWGTVTDPDGMIRDRTQERGKFLAGVRNELDCINSLPPGRILDVGCGLGFLLSGINKEWQRIGVELSEFAADIASKWGTVFRGTLEEASFDSKSFDVVVLHHVIEHVPNPESLIIEIRRILKPDGMLILGTPNFDCGCARLFGGNFRLLNDKSHITLFSEESLRRFLRDYGFSVQHVDHPYFDTPYFTEENFLRLQRTDAISPPFYGNFITFYCHPMTRDEVQLILENLENKLNIFR